MLVHKMVKGEKGAREYARLGGWESLQEFRNDFPEITDTMIQDCYWLNETEGGTPMDMPVLLHTKTSVSTIVIIRNSAYMTEAQIYRIDIEVGWLADTDLAQVFG